MARLTFTLLVLATTFFIASAAPAPISLDPSSTGLKIDASPIAYIDLLDPSGGTATAFDKREEIAKRLTADLSGDQPSGTDILSLLGLDLHGPVLEGNGVNVVYGSD